MESGIYKITNIVNNKCYIGSSINIDRRLKQHLYLLKRNKNHSLLLQKAFNKYGENSFVFEIIDTCVPKFLFKLEQYYVDNIKPEYNLCIKDVSVPIGLKYKDKEKYKELASKRLQSNVDFGWKSQVIEKLDDSMNVIKEYPSLKSYAEEHNCAIGNVGKALKKGNRCKGFYVRYKK